MAVRENEGISRYEPPIEHLVGDEALDQMCAWRLLDECLQLFDIGDIRSVLDPQRTHDVELCTPLVESAKRTNSPIEPLVRLNEADGQEHGGVDVEVEGGTGPNVDHAGCSE